MRTVATAWRHLFEDLLDGMDLPVGAAHYAEPFDAGSFLKMPANALVNVAYVLVGLYWLHRVMRRPESLPAGERGFFLALSTGACLYGPVQFLRIVSQHRAAALLDQWVTLPMFALVSLWGLLRRMPPGPTRTRLVGAGMAVSVASYGLAFFLPRGFELVLLAHIAAAALVCGRELRAARWALPVVWPFAAALLACAAFVGLKHFDHALAQRAPWPRLTGHFWSKIGDALQIHFVLLFFARTATRPPRSA